MKTKQLVKLLISSKILTPQDAHQIAAAYDEACEKSGEKPTVETLGNFLVSNETVTRWQCDQLLNGRWRGFYLDDYLLLERIGKSDVDVSYAARDMRDGKEVCLVMTPMSPTNRRIEYRVERYSE